MEVNNGGTGAPLSHLATRIFPPMSSPNTMNTIISLRVHTIDNIGIYNVMWIEVREGIYYSNIDREWTRTHHTFFPVFLN